MAEAQTNDAALAEGLGAGFPQFPIPIARQELPKVSAGTELKDLIPLYKQTAQRQMEVNQNLAQIDAAQKAFSASKQAEISSRDLQDYEKNLAEKKRKEDQFPYPSFHPTQENAFSLGQIFSMIATAAVSMGNIGKVGGMGALGAMTGMLQGWRQGRIDLFNRERQEFDKKVNEIKLARDAIQKDWNDYLALRSRKIEAARAKLNELLSKVGQNSIIAANIAKGDLNAVNNFLTGVSNVVNKIDEKNREDKRLEARRREIEARERAAEQRFLMNYAQRERLATTKRDEKALQSIGPALRNIAEQYPEGTEKTLAGASPDDKKRIQGSFRALEESEAVADFVARNPRAVGALAVAKNFLRIDAIKSLKSDNESAVASGKAAIIDQQIDNAVAKGQISKDDAESAKVLQKKLFGLALSDVQGSGQRGSVYLDRQFQNLYDQASRQETLLKIIRERAEENNRNLRIYKLNVERNINPENFPLYEADTPERFNQYLKERSPKKIASKQDIQDTARGQRISNEEAKKRLRALGYQIEGEQ